MKETLLDINIPIYIAGHIIPDQDSISSSMALALILKKYNKNVYVLLEDKDKSILDWKKDYSLIKNKIKDDNYAFIALDVNDVKRLGIYKEGYENASIKINIDHHQGNDMNADYTISSTSLSSTCEIIYNLFRFLFGHSR